MSCKVLQSSAAKEQLLVCPSIKKPIWALLNPTSPNFNFMQTPHLLPASSTHWHTAVPLRTQVVKACCGTSKISRIFQWPTQPGHLTSSGYREEQTQVHWNVGYGGSFDTPVGQSFCPDLLPRSLHTLPGSSRGPEPPLSLGPAVYPAGPQTPSLSLASEALH